MLNICLVFWKSEPQYAYKLYAYKKKTCILAIFLYYPIPVYFLPITRRTRTHVHDIFNDNEDVSGY